jgi:DNA-binding NtrC family response regulator
VCGNLGEEHSHSSVVMLDRTENQETILVVEDDVLVRMPISQYLRDCGYKVIEATNAEEAKTILSHKETVINLILWRNGVRRHH